MTDETLFFDNDCISAFLWVDETSIVTTLYKTRIAIPMQVYNELSAGRGQATILKERIDSMIKNSDVILVDMDTDSPEYKLYSELVTEPTSDGRYIGKGEASCIALSKEWNGILASNNFKDIQEYIAKYQLKHTTTADILVDAYDKKILSFEKIENIWSDMLSKRRRLGADTFKDYLKQIGR